MAFDPNNYLIIAGGTQYSPDGSFFIHERINDSGKPGKIVTMADGKGDVNEVAQTYLAQGFDPDKIIINGELASDVFEKSSDVDKPVKPTAKKTLQNALVLYMMEKHPGLTLALAPEQVKESINRENPIKFDKTA